MSKFKHSLHGQYIDPKSYLKVVGHSERQSILNNLFKITLDKPITKKELSKKININYDKLVYQLNNQLREFWKVKRTLKVRGAHSEYIAPEHNNTIYVYMTDHAVVWTMDPLANIFGKLKSTGTRCTNCTSAQIRKCIKDLEEHGNCIRSSVDSKKQMLLLKTNCKEPYTPVDYMLTCTIISELEQEKCVMEFGQSDCVFIKKITGQNH